jgi:hypothetical protein
MIAKALRRSCYTVVVGKTQLHAILVELKTP